MAHLLKSLSFSQVKQNIKKIFDDGKEKYVANCSPMSQLLCLAVNESVLKEFLDRANNYKCLDVITFPEMLPLQTKDLNALSSVVWNNLQDLIKEMEKEEREKEEFGRTLFDENPKRTNKKKKKAQKARRDEPQTSESVTINPALKDQDFQNISNTLAPNSSLPNQDVGGLSTP
ncbi:hypothetical protein FDP41_008125 [Naegleria fowleri]|uniref:Uncharacterized protein n=1 Tax=Naegleria fowleri TaxID=5763 RepID=A0A6A5BG10_NAEFO|nr:uncharacterized protein FDP41_008125 [Naegleria fowleri]KAF0973421.1 hypothetical protein FDP41_008125 [Naegleria fowleri]